MKSSKYYFKLKRIFKSRSVNLLCYTQNQSTNSGDDMKIEEIEITDVGGIPYLKLVGLNPQMNIICGENGVGKTNILESIAYVFTQFSTQTVKRRAGSESGAVNISVNHDKDNSYAFRCKIKNFEPDPQISSNQGGIEEALKYKSLVIFLKTNRALDYKKTTGSPYDPEEEKYAQRVLEGVQSNDIKLWLHSHSLHGNAGFLAPIQDQNIQLAHRLISALDQRYTFSRVDTKGEVLLNSPSGEIYLEYLSSGFKSTFFILLGIIKEIDYRFQASKVSAKDFNGVILIDEIEIHLHPEWQSKIGNILCSAFPNAQFFITTHSPHVVQSAKPGEVIILEREIDEGDKVKSIRLRELPKASKYGFQGWTIEEILEDVMGMVSIRGEDFKGTLSEFENALRGGNKKDAQFAFNKLDLMLHPNSPYRTMYGIEKDSLE